MMHRKVMRVLALIFLVIVITGSSWQVRIVQAQTITVTWDKPVNISNTVGCSAQPAVAADDYGNVHVFWSEDTFGRRCPGAPAAGGSIYYSRHSGDEWTFPVDIITTTLTASEPSAVVDHNGRLHLIWAQLDGIYYSYAKAWAAATAKGWATPVKIVPARFIGTTMQLALGTDDSLHIIYSDWGNAYIPNDGNVYYVNSVDGGDTWSDPQQVSDIAFGQQYAVLPHIALDDQGTVHAVWSTVDTNSQDQLAVYYAKRGTDDKYFSYQRVVMSTKKKGQWMMAINVAVVGEQILLTWGCGDQPYRCYQVSIDRGLAWSSTQRVFGNLLSMANFDALAVDDAGKIYWIAQLRTPVAMYYSIWDREQWSDPPTPFITYGVMTGGHAPAAVVGLGNQIDLVMVDQDRGEIYFTRGVTNSSAVPALQVPTDTPQPTALATSQAPTYTSTPSRTEPVSLTATAGSDVPLTVFGLSVEELIIIIAVVTAVILFAIVILIRSRRFRRR